jgi:hypothetical protein
MTTSSIAASGATTKRDDSARDARLRSIDSASSLSSTVYEDDSELPVGGTSALPSSSSATTSATVVPSGGNGGGPSGFESKFFRFSDFGARSDGDFFSGAASPEFGDDHGDNNEVLPPRTLSPTNQTTHDASSANTSSVSNAKTTVVGVVAPPLPRSVSLGGGGRRKSSIEMFLSQSPSQALGGGFLMMALDDGHPTPPVPSHHRLPPRRHDVSSNASANANKANVSNASVVAIHPPPSQPLEMDAGDRARGGGKEPTAVSAAASAMGPTATSASYGGYMLSHSPPAVDTDDEWSSTSSQEMLGGGGSASSSAAYYYAESQAALHQSQLQQQTAAYGYGSTGANSSSSYRYTSDAYGGGSGRPQQPQHAQHSSWGTASVSQGAYGGAPAQSPYAIQSTLNTSVPAGFAPYQQQQQPQYHQQPPQQVQQGYHHSHHGQLQQSHGHRAPTQRGLGRSQSMYSMSSSSSGGRMMMMESSPPPSPHTSMGGGHYGGVKQCKFYLQGHCRMGNKCKFAHHQPPPSHQHHHSAYHQQPPPPQPQLHQSQSFHVPHSSPATSPHHLAHHHEYDAYMPSTSSSSYMPTRGGSSSRSTYRMGSGSVGSDVHHHLHHVSSSGQLQALAMAPHGSPHHAMATLPGSSLAMAVSQSAPVPGVVDALLQLEDVQGRVFSMSKDQNGCRLLQEQLEYYDERKALCDVIYGEAMDHLAEMMVDPFGNYLFQKLLERARPLQRLEMVRRVGSHLVAAALNLHGTRSVQKVVEVCATSAQVVELASDGSELRRVNLPDLIVDALKDDAVRLCIDSNGNHVIQRALQFMKPEYNQFVFDAVSKECTTVGTHRHGCCVLQRCLDAADDQQKREVIAQVEKQAMKLMQDPYGNYVVQYVLDSCTADEAYGVIVKPLGNVYELSVQKFSSNVIEKCLEKAPPAVLSEYVDEITICPKLQKMLQDQFANYVVQRALSVSAEDQCLALVKAIRPHLPAMKNTSGGRRITARILKRFPHMDLNLEMGFEPAALGASYAMGGIGGMAMQTQYHQHPSQHQQQHQQHHYDTTYAMPFASTSGLSLHGSGGSGRM